MKKFFAALLSIVLVVTLIIMPLCTGVANLLSKNSINDLIEELDLKEIIAEGISLNGAKNEVLSNELDKSEYLDDLINTFTDQLTGALYGEAKKFDEEDFIGMVEDNLDELTEIAKETIPEYSDLTDDQIEEAILASAADAAPEFTEELNSLSTEIKKSDFSEIMGAVRTITFAVVAAVIVLTILIFLLTLKNFSGFFWVSTNYIIAAILAILARIGIDKVLNTLIADSFSDDTFAEVPNILFGKIIGEYNAKITLYIVIFTVCLCIGIIGKIFLSRKNIPVGNTYSPDTDTTSIPENFQ